MRKLLSFSKVQRLAAFALAALPLALMIAGPAFAVEAGDYDWSSDITTNIAGFMAGVAASIAAVFGVAVLAKLTFRAARITLKAVGLIKG